VRYEELLVEAERLGLLVVETSIKGEIKGLYYNGVVWLNNSLKDDTHKCCVLAEEMGHFYTSRGNITNQNDLRNVKQENKARRWAYEKLVPLSEILKAHNLQVKEKYEVAEFLGVTEWFLDSAISYYKEKYGPCVKYRGYTIHFDPLNIRQAINGEKEDKECVLL